MNKKKPEKINMDKKKENLYAFFESLERVDDHLADYPADYFDYAVTKLRNNKNMNFNDESLEKIRKLEEGLHTYQFVIECLTKIFSLFQRSSIYLSA